MRRDNRLRSLCPPLAREAGLSREGVLLASVLLLAALFVVTGFVTRLYHAKEQALAQEWFGRGEAELQAGHPTRALKDFRTSLVYSPDDNLYQLRLAQALSAAGRDDEARAYLNNLWEREPGDGRVNLELARLAVRERAQADALRYYHIAASGAWPENPQEKQWEVRTELCELLLRTGALPEAQTEIAESAATIPANDTARLAQAGQLFLRAQDSRHALDEFQRALQSNRRQPDALAGAGEAAFLLGEYAEAQRYLDREVKDNPKDAHATELLATAREVRDSDPYEMTLSGDARRQRVLRAFERALARLESCARQRGEGLTASPAQTNLEQLGALSQALRGKMNEPYLRAHPEIEQDAMGLVFDIEQVTAGECGQPQGGDAALLLLAKKYGNGKS